MTLALQHSYSQSVRRSAGLLAHPPSPPPYVQTRTLLPPTLHQMDKKPYLDVLLGGRYFYRGVKPSCDPVGKFSSYVYDFHYSFAPSISFLLLESLVDTISYPFLYSDDQEMYIEGNGWKWKKRPYRAPFPS